MSTDWTLLSALKNNCFPLREGQLLHIASNFDLIFCNCFKAGEQKRRPCAFMIFLFANLVRGRVVSFRGDKVIKDGGHQVK